MWSWSLCARGITSRSSRVVAAARFLSAELNGKVFTSSNSLLFNAGEWRTPHSSKDISRILENGSDLEGNFVGATGKVLEKSTATKENLFS